MEGADLLGALVLDAPALSVALDQLLDGHLLPVGEDQRGLLAAEAVDGDLAEGPALDRDEVFVVGGRLVFAGTVQAGLGPRADGQRLQGLDQLRGALAQCDEADAQLVELGEVLLGGELAVEDEQLREGAMRLLVEAAEGDHLAGLRPRGQFCVCVDDRVLLAVLGDERQHRAGAL